MRAVLMEGPSEGPDRTRLREVEVPRPGPDEVSIDVDFAGVNFLDVMARRGDPGYVPAWPYVPGLEVAGTVRELGPGVGALSVGQRVAALTAGGGLAEVALARAAHTVPVPDEVSSATAAAAPVMLSTAMLLLIDVGRLGGGESVLVHSASGGVGSAVAQLVPALGGGLRVGVVGRAEKVAAARKSGYDLAFARGDGLADAVLAATGGRGVDVVLDPLGTGMLDVDLAVTVPGGRIVLFGNAGGGAPGSLPGVAALIGGNKSVCGFSIRGLAAFAPARVAGAMDRVLGLIANGRLDVAVTDVGSLAEVPAVHQLLADGRGAGKYVVRCAVGGSH